MKRILIHSVFPASYRINLFELMAEDFDLFIVFERDSDYNRSNQFFMKSSKLDYVILSDGKDAISRYKKELKKLSNFDYVIAYDYSSKSALKLLLRSIAKKIPYAINCDGSLHYPKNIKSLIKRFFIKKADLCLSSGESATKYFLSYGANLSKVRVHNFSSLYDKDIIDMPISKIKKDEIRSSLGLPSDQKIIISVGQFTLRKGFDVLLETWKSPVFKDYLLLLIGGGEEQNALENYLVNNSMKNVIIMDFLNKSNLFKYYQASDLFILLTREDIWGLVINEAMANSLPVITTDKCVAGNELIENYTNGFIVSLDDIENIRKRILYILTVDEQREKMQLNNLDKIRNFTLNNTKEKHKKDIYERL